MPSIRKVKNWYAQSFEVRRSPYSFIVIPHRILYRNSSTFLPSNCHNTSASSFPQQDRISSYLTAPQTQVLPPSRTTTTLSSTYPVSRAMRTASVTSSLGFLWNAGLYPFKPPKIHAYHTHLVQDITRNHHPSTGHPPFLTTMPVSPACSRPLNAGTTLQSPQSPRAS